MVERTCHIVSLMIKNLQQCWFDDNFGLKSSCASGLPTYKVTFKGKPPNSVNNKWQLTDAVVYDLIAVIL